MNAAILSCCLGAEVLISPPALYLDFVLKNLRKDAAVCAQNIWPGAKVVLVADIVLYFYALHVSAVEDL